MRNETSKAAVMIGKGGLLSLKISGIQRAGASCPSNHEAPQLGPFTAELMTLTASQGATWLHRIQRNDLGTLASGVEEAVSVGFNL